jgi:hypothetical protein
VGIVEGWLYLVWHPYYPRTDFDERVEGLEASRKGPEALTEPPLKKHTMDEIIEKYEAKLEALNRAYELKGPYLTRGDLEVLNQIKILLTGVVTDLRAIRAFTKK